MFVHSFLVTLLVTVPSLASASLSPNFPAPILDRAPVIVTTTLSPDQELFRRIVAPSTTTTSSTTSSTSTSACPNGQAAFAVLNWGGAKWNVCQATDISSDNIAVSSTGQNLNTCSNLCSQMPGCIAAVYKYLESRCYFKRSQSPVIDSNSLYVFAIFKAGVNAVFAPTSSITTSSASILSSLQPTTTTIPSSAPTTTSISTLVASTSSSITTSSTTTSTSSTSSPNTSKSVTATSAPTTAATTVTTSLTTSTSPSSISTPSCPAGTLAQQTAADGTLWMVCDDSYIVSETIGTLVPGHDVEACYASCNARSDCLSFTYDLVHYECLFKTTRDISPYGGPNFNGDSSIVFVRISNGVNATLASVTSTIATVSTIASTALSSSTTSSALGGSTGSSSRLSSSSSTSLSATSSSNVPSSLASTSSFTSTTLSTSTRRAITTSSSPSSVCADGRPPKSTRTVSNGDKYAVCKGNDFYGGDMGASLTIHTLRDCMEACTSQFGCIGASFIPGNCWLKNVIKPASIHDGEDAFYKISSGTTVAIDPSATSKVTPCMKVTTGYMCPSEEVYYRRDKTMCNLSKDDAAAVCDPK